MSADQLAQDPSDVLTELLQVGWPSLVLIVVSGMDQEIGQRLNVLLCVLDARVVADPSLDLSQDDVLGLSTFHGTSHGSCVPRGRIFLQEAVPH